MVIYIKENSWLAKIAARQLKSNRAAIVVRNTIYLWGATRTELIQNKAWLQHEVAHVYQYKSYGTLRFIALYVFESASNGYYNNRFEKEARSQESNTRILNNIVFR